MKWIKKPGPKSAVKVTTRNPEEDLARAKAHADAMDSLRERCQHAKDSKLQVRKDAAASGLGEKRSTFHQDAIPAGTLCYLRKHAREYYGFDFCTVLKQRVGLGGWAEAEVLTPAGNIVILSAMMLRPMDVQNGNTDESKEPSDEERPPH